MELVGRIVPAVRETRTPLISGFAWLLAFWLWVGAWSDNAERLLSAEPDPRAARPLWLVRESLGLLSGLGAGIALTVSALIVGSLFGYGWGLVVKSLDERAIRGRAAQLFAESEFRLQLALPLAVGLLALVRQAPLTLFGLAIPALMAGHGVLLRREAMGMSLRADLSGADLSSANLAGANLTHIDLSEANLQGADLTGAVLNDTRFSGARLDGAIFDRTDLTKTWGVGLDALPRLARLRDVTLVEQDLSGASLAGVDLRGADLSSANLRGAILRGANLSRARVTDAGLDGADLGGVDLSHVDLQGHDLSNRDLAGAKLTQAVLIGADLRGSVLREASLNRADLEHARLDGAELVDANLNRASMSGARLPDANLDRADLDHADLRRAHLQGARLRRSILTGAKLDGAMLDRADLTDATVVGVERPDRLAGAKLDGTAWAEEDRRSPWRPTSSLGGDIRHRLRDFAVLQPAQSGVVGVLLLVAGLFFALAAVQTPSLVAALALATSGALFVVVGASPLNQVISRFVTEPGMGRRGPLLGLGAIVVGLSLWLLAATAVSATFGVIGTASLVIGVLALRAWIVDRSLQAAGTWLGVGLGLTGIGPIIMGSGQGFDGPFLFGLGVTATGLGVLAIGLQAWLDADAGQRRFPTLIVSISVLAAGVVALVVAATASSRIGVFYGAVLVLGAVRSVGAALSRTAIARGMSVTVLVAGVILLVLGSLLMWQVTRTPELVLLVAALMAAVGASAVVRGLSLGNLIAVGLVVSWVFTDRTVDTPTDPNPASELTIVAFGDSFPAGEGAPRYFPDTNTPGIANNACRRAPTAYPWLVADRLEASLIFLACSGARTVDMDNTANSTSLPDPLGPVPGHEDQVQRLLATSAERVEQTDVVLVSVGASDVDLYSILASCLLPSTCATDDRAGQWIENARQVEDALVDTYGLLRTTFGADTPIVAVPYPQIVAPTGRCEIMLGQDEIEFVSDLTETLNGSITRAAARAGINVYPSSEQAFTDRTLCDDDPASNLLHLSPTEGSMFDRLSPANWVHGSMHPRPTGHELIADGMVSGTTGGSTDGWLIELLDSTRANPEPTGGPDVGEIGVAPEVVDERWLTEQLYQTIASLILPLGLLLTGGLLYAYGALRAGLLVLITGESAPD